MVIPLRDSHRRTTASGCHPRHGVHRPRRRGSAQSRSRRGRRRAPLAPGGPGLWVIRRYLASLAPTRQKPPERQDLPHRLPHRLHPGPPARPPAWAGRQFGSGVACPAALGISPDEPPTAHPKVNPALGISTTCRGALASWRTSSSVSATGVTPSACHLHVAEATRPPEPHAKPLQRHEPAARVSWSQLARHERSCSNGGDLGSTQ
jgi:hypothetical protein